MDWYVLLTPLLLLPIVSLLAFVGCSLETEGGLAGPDLVSITYPGLALEPYVREFEFWCYRDGFESPNRFAATSFERETEVLIFKLEPLSKFQDPPPTQCGCRGTVTWASGDKANTTEPVGESPVSQFPVDTGIIHFSLSVISKWGTTEPESFTF